MSDRSDNELRAAYLATEVFVDLDGSNSLEHYMNASDAARRLGGPLFVLTAHNPASVELDDAENDRRNVELRGDIVAQGITVHPAIGRSPDGSWFEPGFALVGVDRATANGLGSKYGQNAVFEVRPDRVIVHACDGSYRLERRT